MRSILVIPAMIFVSTLSAEPPISEPLVLKSGKTTFIIPQKGPDGAEDWAAVSCRGGGETQVLHALVRRADVCYVLFTSAGWSRGAPSDRGQCGSGWEKQINWMRIENGTVMSHQQRDLESCWTDAFGSIHGWKGSSLFWSAYERDGDYECYFDSLQPEKGIQIKSFTPNSTGKIEP